MSSEPIAIVGSACRFAGNANSPSRLWGLLKDPRDLRQEIPGSRFNAKGFYHPDGSYHGQSNVSHAYFVDDDMAAFDAEFFGIRPAEAKAMDPQQRYLMEVAFEGLEAAGMLISDLRGSDTSVYVGVMFDDYGNRTGRSILSNRISHFFDWHGPSVTIDTACSSSLVAVHMAIQALRSGDSRMSLACGSNLIIGPESFIIESKLKMLSPDGRSRMWDQGANGYARGDGVACVVLKTLRAALEDGDHIECLIRETGLNQDGATAGITMPRAEAQEALIRSTYAKAGLDLQAVKDRPQYFEAHGTGTPAGDPVEAEAIHKAFFEGQRGGLELGGGDPLYVGSIKTVLGHTEGTAGVAAIIKASLALQHSIVPPNLLFDKLADSVAPFYKNVEILGTARQWPNTSGTVRRASVNSFGFGGTNAHAILESYERDGTTASVSGERTQLFTPFVFSATSEKSLRAMISAYAGYLGCEGLRVSPRDLAYTLRERRACFRYRVPVTASSIEDLKNRILASLADEDARVGTEALPNVKNQVPRILGIFTGQGAQYPRMAAELIERSEKAREIIQTLETYLAQLGIDSPAWSLQAEILADASSSRVHEAVISQPLCTAVQILLVDMLKLAGVQFDAVVGHSSGEIAAAYAAGYLTSRDAMCIAYYHGSHINNAASPNGNDIQGAMLAVGSSMEYAEELCSDPLFQGRITVAASNSSSSVTISGDEDAIAELQLVLEDEQKFNRRLKVDKAYHSRHMLPCFEPYMASLRNANIRHQVPTGTRTWYSSVHHGLSDPAEGLGDLYWAENLTKPVLFSQALGAALAAGSYDVAIEVGAHPALKGPATQAIQSTLGSEIPYVGILRRGTDAVEASSSGLGALWSHLGNDHIDLGGYERALTGHKQHLRIVKGLPTYQWDHSTRHWHESRSSRKMRLRSQIVHPLLGEISVDSAPHHMSWKNLLRVGEMPWLEGHQVQDQVVFPAAGYLTSALEASRVLAEDNSIGLRLVDFRDFTIHRAVAFPSSDTSLEARIEMADVSRDQHTNRIRAKFTYSAALEPLAEDLSLVASGAVEIHLGEASRNLLPARTPDLPHMIDVETDRFYQSLKDLGYDFDGRFRSLSSLRRKYGRSSCLVNLPKSGDDLDLLIHPAELDAVFQSCILAYSYPYDQMIRSLHLPTTIGRIRINPAVLVKVNKRVKDEFGPVKAVIKPQGPGQKGICGYVDFYIQDCPHAAIQIQDAKFEALGGLAEEDRRVFSKVNWFPSNPNGGLAGQEIYLGQEHRDMVELLERVATFHLRKFHREVATDDPIRSEFPTNWYLNYARYITEMVDNGTHKWARPEWLQDTAEDIERFTEPYSAVPDVEIMQLVGKQMPRVFRGEANMLEQFRQNDILDRYYAGGLGLKESAQWVGRTVKQLTDRYPHMNILETGAGTGGATKAVFREINDNFQSYTFTDISAAFFENASNVFSQQKDRIIFKLFNAEEDPVKQGFVEGSYDLVIAFFVIHATSDLGEALRNIRKLLKPGGFLVVGEGQEGMNGVASSGFIFGTLPGWWLGVDKGRVLSPHVSPEEWDKLLRENGFSGVDCHSSDTFKDVLNVYHFATQAVDDQVRFLREPLSKKRLAWRPTPIKRLFLVGGETSRTQSLVRGLKSIFTNELAGEVHDFSSLLRINYDLVDVDSTVISLTELDKPVFKGITSETFGAFKKMFETGKTLLWVTSGRLDDEPYSNMTVGFGRTAAHECPDLRLQQLDIADPLHTRPEMIAEVILRLHASGSLPKDLVWTSEPEIVVDKNGRETVSRLRPITQLNDRYNSSRRVIVREMGAKNRPPISVHVNADETIIKELSRYEASAAKDNASEDNITLQTTYTLASAIKSPIGNKFLALGLLTGTDIPYLALVPSLASELTIPSEAAVPMHIPGIAVEKMLPVIGAHLIAIHVLTPLYSGQTLLVHNASGLIAEAISSQAKARGVKVIYAVDSGGGEHFPDSWIRVPDYVRQADLADVLDAAPSGFVNLSSDSTANLDNEAAILSVLPPSCSKVTAKTLFSFVGSESKPALASVLGEVLRRAIGYVGQGALAGSYTPQFAALDQLARGVLTLEDHLAVIDFTAAASLPVRAARLDTRPMFKGRRRTYWIVGMSGALGISLCDWMISSGARNIVMTSRDPDISEEWISAHKRKGANVLVVPCDVTNERALKDAHELIVSRLPPIAGIFQGAMVLRDVSIHNMTYQQLIDVIRPKVDGSIYLDRIFYEVDLDFFILVSSINSVIGNWGQANYAAANTFMCSLAAQRRKRGLRAATVNAGAIIGAGYMERESRRALDLIVQKLNMMHMSEEDWCQALCEAIDASRLDSPHGPELTTGLSDIAFDSPNAPNWFSNPKFSSFVIHRGIGWQDKKEEKVGTSIRDLLQSCTSSIDLQEIIKRAFAAQLRNILQVTTSDDDLMASRSSEIGLDSLVSVDIRSWFLKALGVSIPVLQIMGNDTMSNLVQHAAEAIPTEMTPILSKGPIDGANNREDDNITSPSLRSHPSNLTPEASESSMPTTPREASDIGKIDWIAESTPPADLAELARTRGSHPVVPPRVIVLTGAGGLLGHNLLQYLLESLSAVKIHCIALRNLASRLHDKQLPDSPRVTYYEGDLAAPLLGLTSEEASAIFAEADVVIHNGADTSHMKYYKDLKATNVGSTATLVRLCLPRGIPIHYVSSAGVAIYHNELEFPEVSITGPKSSLPAADGSFGYGCSKWTNERFLEQVQRLYDLRVYIHRPSTIIREGEDTRGTKAQMDWVNALLHYSREIRAVPLVENNRGALDLVYVRTCCGDITRHILDDSDKARREVVYVHEVGDVVVPFQQLRHWNIGLDGPEGVVFEVLPMREWVAKAIVAGLHPAVAALIETMDSPGMPDYPRLLKNRP
ncbi:Type I Iterative PKS [Cytospora paraplurivora]|uniref:Type I Iterative PKS n=1 Tax=Cytospora paraplurivora TaxID=2898453 RepID=A0AAN9YFN9_9PEZI